MLQLLMLLLQGVVQLLKNPFGFFFAQNLFHMLVPHVLSHLLEIRLDLSFGTESFDFEQCVFEGHGRTQSVAKRFVRFDERQCVRGCGGPRLGTTR